MADTAGCGKGGWTLVMKVDGNKNDFNYSSSYWTNKKTFAVEDGLEGLSEKQTKMASYWNTPFTRICLGMKVNDVTNWITIDKKARSLFDVIAGGATTRTTAGKETWKSLIAGSSLQNNCNDEGFNLRCQINELYMRVRIGLVANNEVTCDTCDSYIGLGVSYLGCGIQSTITCGNLAVCHSSSHYNADTYIWAFGYILVQ
ncbi:uncharacterized skeletal organic matrix protein 5-like [Dendronephthya gigantea]|nr:uncharacterized skeletal organic matrix protein 5-like [Dendronephthya gigantea]